MSISLGLGCDRPPYGDSCWRQVEGGGQTLRSFLDPPLLHENRHVHMRNRFFTCPAYLLPPYSQTTVGSSSNSLVFSGSKLTSSLLSNLF